jgi:hypothetical protein
MVVDDASHLGPLVGAGENVVFVLDPGAPPIQVPEGPGRVAVLVGRPDDETVRSAADEMHRELFGTRPGARSGSKRRGSP